MIVDCAHYVDGSRQSDRTISSDEAALQIYQGGFVWLGMFEPSGEELDEVRYTVITKLGPTKMLISPKSTSPLSRL